MRVNNTAQQCGHNRRLHLTHLLLPHVALWTLQRQTAVAKDAAERLERLGNGGG
jgi:phosphoglycerate dehydrogenase-like enzyme